MRKIILLLVSLFMSFMPLLADGKDIPLIPIDDGNTPNDPGVRHFPARLPTIVYDGSFVEIASYHPLCLQIIIRDEDGDIIYNNVVSFIPPTLTLPLPTEVDEEKYSIELLYGDWHLIGYF